VQKLHIGCNPHHLLSKVTINMNDSLQLFEKELSLVTKPIPKVNNPDDVLIRVAYSGICGTDLHIIAGEFPSSTKALTLGHEFSGIIEKVGSSVTTFKSGDRVVVNPNNNCHVCSYCIQGQIHFCKTGGLRSTVGIWRNGGWSQFCRVPSCLVHKVPDNLPLRLAALVEPYSCICRGFHQLGEVNPEAKILICGAGIIGLLWSTLLHFKGFRNIVVSEISEKRRNMVSALNLGFTVALPDYLVSQQRESIRNGDDDWGFDVIIDCTGVPKAIEQAFNWLRRGAKFVIFGCCPKDSKIELNPFDIFNKELKIIGSLINPFTFPTAIRLTEDMAGAYLDFGKLGIQSFPLHEYSSALTALKNGVVSKALFVIDDSLDSKV